MDKQYYHGWLYANMDDYDALRVLGVFGPMIYTPSEGNSVNRALEKKGTIGYCLCDYETLLKLQGKYEELWRTKYPHYDNILWPKTTTVYPDFVGISKGEVEYMKGAHYYWNDE